MAFRPLSPPAGLRPLGHLGSRPRHLILVASTSVTKRSVMQTRTSYARLRIDPTPRWDSVLGQYRGRGRGGVVASVVVMSGELSSAIRWVVWVILVSWDSGMIRSRVLARPARIRALLGGAVHGSAYRTSATVPMCPSGELTL